MPAGSHPATASAWGVLVPHRARGDAHLGRRSSRAVRWLWRRHGPGADGPPPPGGWPRPILDALAHAHWRARGHAAGAGRRRPIPSPTGRLATPPAGPRPRARNVASPGTGPPLHVHRSQVESFTVQRGQVGYERVGGTGRFPTPCPTGDAASGTAVPKCVLTRVRSHAARPGAARPHTRRGLVRRRAPSSRPHRR